MDRAVNYPRAFPFKQFPTCLAVVFLLFSLLWVCLSLHYSPAFIGPGVNLKLLSLLDFIYKIRGRSKKSSHYRSNMGSEHTDGFSCWEFRSRFNPLGELPNTVDDTKKLVKENKKLPIRTPHSASYGYKNKFNRFLFPVTILSVLESLLRRMFISTRLNDVNWSLIIFLPIS